MLNNLIEDVNNSTIPDQTTEVDRTRNYFFQLTYILNQI